VVTAGMNKPCGQTRSGLRPEPLEIEAGKNGYALMHAVH